MIDSKTIQRYSKYSTPDLIKIAEKHFNKFIRKRDEGQGCICCGGKNYMDIEAGHFYSAGSYPTLRFNEDNVHGQSKHCNRHKHGNLLEYRKHLIERIGIERVERLEFLVSEYKHNGHKWDRLALIDIIETYKKKNK